MTPDAVGRLGRARPSAVPLALAVLHRACSPGDEFDTNFAATDDQRARDLIVGGGFEAVHLTVADRRATARVRRRRSLADTVGPSMRLLVSGLNPSLYAADAGVGFARPGNRFWPAALAAGLVTEDRDPVAALRAGIGMTDLVKRATPRADALTVHEYLDGLARIERLAAWLRPRAVVFVGLAGWRAAADPRAIAGVQGRLLGGRPVYVMPSTSGLNASSTLESLAGHLAAAARLTDDGPDELSPR